MEVRKANAGEIGAILEIYAGARDFMKKSGNPTQWSGGYPDKEVIKADVEAERLYVLCEGDEIFGVFALFTDGDPDYNVIDGAWLNSLPYAAMHRVASAGKRGGVFAECVNYVLSRFDDIRIDTHEDNIPMQRSLERFGFIRCRKVYITRAGERIAYHYHK